MPTSYNLFDLQWYQQVSVTFLFEESYELWWRDHVTKNKIYWLVYMKDTGDCCAEHLLNCFHSTPQDEILNIILVCSHTDIDTHTHTLERTVW